MNTGLANRLKTHCPQGHPYDAENTLYVQDRRNYRVCRACGRERARQYRKTHRRQSRRPACAICRKREARPDRVTCGRRSCIEQVRIQAARERGGQYCPRCGQPRGHGQRGQSLTTCGSEECVKWARGCANRRETWEKPVDPAVLKPNDPRSCRCGAKLSYLVDMWGQTSMECDRCHFHADFGRHPMRAA